MQEGKGYKKMVGEGSFKNFMLYQNVVKNLKLTEFRPKHDIFNSHYIAPNQQTQHQNVYLQPMQNTAEKCMPCQQEDLNERHSNARIKKVSFSTSTNTLLPANQLTQTIKARAFGGTTGTTGTTGTSILETLFFMFFKHSFFLSCIQISLVKPMHAVWTEFSIVVIKLKKTIEVCDQSIVVGFIIFQKEKPFSLVSTFLSTC